jgi:hypothetical protein
MMLAMSFVRSLADAIRARIVAGARCAGWTALLALTLAACGGSGSSGFDGAPASESDAIMQAVDEQSCVVFETVVYCGSAAEVSVGGEGATVAIEDPMIPVVCTQDPEDAECVATVDIQPSGFPTGTAFRAAASHSIDGPWILSADVPPPSSGGSGGDGEAVDVQVPSAGPSAPPQPLVVAFLIYLTPPPADLPSDAPQLSDFEPDIVYVGRLEFAAE